MMYILGSLVLLLSMSVWECHGACARRGVECPNYQVIGRHQAFEERLYPSTTWVSTSLDGPSLNEACDTMYRKLFSYIKGNNLKGTPINTTTPVRTRIVPCHGATCATMFIMSFLIPSNMAENPPYPSDPALFIEQDPSLKYVVKMFDGRPTESDWIEQLHQLAQLVKKDPGIDKSYYYAVWYDSPFQFFHRLNEVWMVKKDSMKPANETTHSSTERTFSMENSHKIIPH